jgi:hypothetical protein
VCDWCPWGIAVPPTAERRRNRAGVGVAAQGQNGLTSRALFASISANTPVHKTMLVRPEVLNALLRWRALMRVLQHRHCLPSCAFKAFSIGRQPSCVRE